MTQGLTDYNFVNGEDQCTLTQNTSFSNYDKVLDKSWTRSINCVDWFSVFSVHFTGQVSWA